MPKTTTAGIFYSCACSLQARRARNQPILLRFNAIQLAQPLQARDLMVHGFL
jgi:hypothetical protein